MSRQLAQPVVPTVFDFKVWFFRRPLTLRKTNAMLTLEFYQNKLDGLTVLCSEPNIRLRKNCFEGLVLALTGIIQGFQTEMIHSSHPLKTGGFSGLTKG